mgnify:CR=1 FL=1
MAEIIAALISLYGVLEKGKVNDTDRLTHQQFVRECVTTALLWSLIFIVPLTAWSSIREALDLPIVPEVLLRFFSREELSFAPFFECAVIIANRCFYHYLRTAPTNWPQSRVLEWRIRLRWINLVANSSLLSIVSVYYIVTRW